MITLDDLRTEKKAEILRLAQLHGATDIRVFGSVARGDNTEESDVDFLVEMEKDRSLWDMAGLLADLQDLLGVKVDLVTSAGLKYIRERVLAEAQSL